jgi:hypothetical protein
MVMPCSTKSHFFPDADTPTFHTLTREHNHGRIKFDLVTVGKLQNLFDKIILVLDFLHKGLHPVCLYDTS